MTIHNQRRSKGYQRTRTYVSWMKMRERVRNPNHKSYPDYGGRGITIDPRWDDFRNFYVDMGRRPSRAYTLDRIDGEGNYCLENCRWATRRQQNRNRKWRS